MIPVPGPTCVNAASNIKEWGTYAAKGSPDIDRNDQ